MGEALLLAASADAKIGNSDHRESRRARVPSRSSLALIAYYHLSLGGTIFLTSKRLVWCASGSVTPVVSVPFETLTAHMYSKVDPKAPPGSDKRKAGTFSYYRYFVLAFVKKKKK